MESIVGFVIGILAVVCAFGFIIFIHELGHYLTARAVDIRCPQFAIGFGPSLFGFRWRGTNFAVRAFPVGGYVMMNGEEPGERSDDPWPLAVASYLGGETFPATPEKLLKALERTPEEERGEAWNEVRDQVLYARTKEFPNLGSVEGNFHDRPVGARILVISGGVLMNFIATILLLWVLGPMVGVGAFFSDWTPVISQAVPESPADGAGLQPGDVIQRVGDLEVSTNLEAFYAIGEHPGVPLELTVRKRGGEVVELALVPDLKIGAQAYGVDEDGGLTLKADSTSPELVGKKVIDPTRAELVDLTREGEVKEYGVTFEGQDAPHTFELPTTFTGPRGQIGVLFGVSGIRFERELGGEVITLKPGSPAELAGIQVGDQVISVGQLALIAPSGQIFGSLADKALASVARVDQIADIEILILRDGKAEIVAIPKAESASTLDDLGITLNPLGTKDLITAPFSMIGQMIAAPYMIFSGWLSAEYSGTEIVENLQGPIGIMQILYQISDNGLVQFVFFLALLNAAIGAFNLLPFPALDGSRLVFLFIAAVRGRAVDPDKEAKIHLVGLLLLLGFVVLVSFGDIRRLISSHLFVL